MERIGARAGGAATQGEAVTDALKVALLELETAVQTLHTFVDFEEPPTCGACNPPEPVAYHTAWRHVYDALKNIDELRSTGQA